LGWDRAFSLGRCSCGHRYTPWAYLYPGGLCLVKWLYWGGRRASWPTHTVSIPLAPKFRRLRDGYRLLVTLGERVAAGVEGQGGVSLLVAV
jgi:hypothetical protein